MKIITNDNTITELTPELLAEALWAMGSDEQARFYNHLNVVADGGRFAMQLQHITDDNGLTLGGRWVMGVIGEYSHWGLVPKIGADGVVK